MQRRVTLQLKVSRRTGATKCQSARDSCPEGIGREDANSNRARIFVRNLRRKLGDDAANPDYIFSERGVGYRMPEPGEE